MTNETDTPLEVKLISQGAQQAAPTSEEIQNALGYSRNFATAKPNIGSMEKEHILGLCNLLERVSRQAEQGAVKVPRAKFEREVNATNAECNDWAREYEMRMEAIAERNKLEERCREMEVERDEADRRAGAAERKLAEEVDSRRRRDTWLHKAKEEAGYAQEESFDNVWAETLGKANERDTLRAEVERLRKASELDREMQRAASELPDGWEIRVCVECGAGWVELTNPDGEGIADTWSGQESLSCEVSDAIDAALEASR